MFLSLLLSILWNVGVQRTREDEQQVLTSREAAVLLWQPSTTELSLKLHKSSLGRLALAETKQVLPTSPVFWCFGVRCQTSCGLRSPPSLAHLAEGFHSRQGTFQGQPWVLRHQERPTARTASLYHRCNPEPAAVWGQSSEKCTGSFPLTPTPPGQGAELAARRRQLPAGPSHPWSNFSQAAALSRRSETYHGIWQRSAAFCSSDRGVWREKLQTPSVRLLENLFSDHHFLLFLLAVEKTLHITWATLSLGHFPSALHL